MLPKTGDAANITAYVQIDGGAVTALGDTSASELSATNAPGSYQFDLTQAETNGNILLFTAKSGTANIVLYPVRIDTTAPSSNGITLAAIATAIWQDATPADFTAVGSIGKGLFTGGIIPGNAGGLIWNGTNNGVFTLGVGGSCNFVSPNFVGDFNVTGDVIFAANFSAAAIVSFGGFAVSGDTNFAAVTLSGDLTLSGAVLAVHVDNDIRGCMLQANSISTGTFTAGAITAAVIATGAVDADALATDAVTEISAGVWDRLTTALTTVGSIGRAIVTYISGLGGAFDLTITVKDNNGVLLQNVRFNIFDGTNQLVASGFTDAAGQSTDSYPAGTFTVALVKANYLFAALTRTVTGAQTGTLKNDLVMTVITPIISPADPTLQTVFGRLVNAQGPAVNVRVTFDLISTDPARPVTVNGNVFAFDQAVAITDGTGNFTIDVPQTILFDDPTSVFYHIICTKAGIDLDRVTVGAVPLDIEDL